MEDLGEIARTHYAIFMNGYVLCDWVKAKLECFDISQEDIDIIVNDMIAYVEEDGDDDD